MKRIHIVETEQYNNTFPPEEIEKAIPWFSEKFGQIPGEYLASARIEFSAYDSYGDSCVKLEIYYDRPYTEMEQREIDAAAADLNSRREAKERAELAKLKAKYGE